VSQPKAYLYAVHKKKGLPEEIILDKPVTALGRHPSNDIALNFSSISRFHARIEYHDNHFFIKDLDSSNGTYVNGRRTDECKLTDGDILLLGNVELQFLLESMSEHRRRPRGAEEPDVEVITSKVRSDALIRSKIMVHKTPLPGAQAELLDPETLLQAHIRLATLYKLSDILRSVPDEREMLRRVLNLIFDVLPADQGAVLFTGHDANAPLRAALVKHRRNTTPPNEVAVNQTIIDRCITERVAILSSDASTDSRFKSSKSIVTHDIRATMCVPLIIQNKVIGIIHVDNRTNVDAFSEEDLAFLTSIANELAVSIEHLRLREEIILKERMAAIGETVTNIAHNIKNMLLLSKGGREIMDKSIERGSLDSIKGSWGIIEGGLDKISDMVGDMLEYSRKRKIEYSSCHINKLICSIVDSLKDELKRKNIELRLELDNQIPTLRLDEEGLHRAILNLIVNAVESIEQDHGVIEIATNISDDGILFITVKDNGRGIPEEDLSRIFYPFFTTKGTKGTGLGLSITRKIIEEQGGTIEVESEPGKRTSFRVAVPTVETKAEK